MKKLFICIHILFCTALFGAEEFKDLLGVTRVSVKPLIYVRNLPWYQECEPYIQKNAPTYLKYDRSLEEVRNSCSNCLDKKRLITPIRVEYISPGTRFLVKGTFRKRNQGRTSDFVIVEDQKGNLSEISDIGFKVSMTNDARLDEEEKEALRASEVYSKNQKVSLKLCDHEKIVIDEMIKDFKLTSDITSSEIFEEARTCSEYIFSNLTGYLTYRHFKDEWSFVSFQRK